MTDQEREIEIEILPINPGSDGDGRKWPKHGYVRNDDYFKERIASDKWIKDLPGGPQPGIIYRLDKMPNGYAGFERARPDSKQIDRYVYGHPNGQFRSLNEFYPHFKHLMDFGGPVGCTCKLCVNGSSRTKTKGAGVVAGVRASGSGNTSATSDERKVPDGPKNLISPYKPRPGEHEEPWQPKKRKLNDDEDVPDIYESMIQQLKDAGPEKSLDELINERMSPDWRVGKVACRENINELSKLPRYVPRPGEMVLFDDKLMPDERLAWHEKEQTFKHQQIFSAYWLQQPQWKAGVVTQIPTEEVANEDLVVDENKEKSVNESGFRIQLLSKPGSVDKSFSKQLKYLPLHCLRPFYLWQACLNGVPREQWHPTVEHALTVAASFCVVDRFRFRGTWPNATVFARGVYLGPELILVGDTVRLSPRPREQRADNVTDIMVVTAIRLRFVNLDMEEDDMAPELPGLPYQTCLHFSGRVFTLDPKRSFDGVGKVPIDPDSDVLPVGIAAYGQWYHYSDPSQSFAKIELPYTRVVGRVVEGAAISAWFHSNAEKPESSFQAINSKAAIASPDDNLELTRGLQSTLDSRIFSQKNDRRIKSQEGKAWFWADTRVEQLDLHEVNQLDVGVKNKERTRVHMAKWKAALKAIDGKKGAVEEYQAVKSKLKEQAKSQSSSYGMMRAAASSTEPEGIAASGSGSRVVSEQEMEKDDDAMDVDEEETEIAGIPIKPAPLPSSGTKPSPAKPVDALRTMANASRVSVSMGVAPPSIARPTATSRSQSGSGSGSASGSDEAGFTTLPTVPPRPMESITLDDSDDEEDAATNQMVDELSKNIRAGDSRRGGSESQAIDLD